MGLIGRRIRDDRKALRINATVAAEAANMSRVTLHRIESGEASVTMGAYLNVASALGLEIGMQITAPRALVLQRIRNLMRRLPASPTGTADAASGAA